MGSRGRIGELWRHPVKSAGGERMGALLVGADGVVGDRAWAVRDVASGAVLSAKREPRLLQLSARADGEGFALSLPDGRSAAGGEADDLVSEWLGRAARIDPAAVDRPRGGFVDEAHLHLLAAAELGDWDARRFRPNVVVADVDDLNHLVGERVRLGAVVVEVYKRTKRCAMPTMVQPGLAKDTGLLRTLAAERDLRLGVYAQVVTPGRLEVGAPITIA